MNDLQFLWKKWRWKTRRFSRWILIPTICYLELLFRFWIGGSFSPAAMVELLGFSVAFGCLLNTIGALLSKKGSRWYSGICIFLCTAVMMVEFLIGDAYYNYMRPVLVLASAGGVITDYTDTMFIMIFRNLWRILIALIPFLLLLLSGKAEKHFNRRKCIAICLGAGLIGLWLGFAGLTALSGGPDKVIAQYDFSTSMKKYGVTASMYLDLSGAAEKAGDLSMAVPDFEIVPPAPTETVPETAEATAPAETEASARASEATLESSVPASEPDADSSAIPEKASEAIIIAESAPIDEETIAEAVRETTEYTPEAVTEPAIEAPTEPVTELPTEQVIEAPTEPEKKEYRPHVIEGLDFAKLAETESDPVRRKVFNYIASLTPAMENDYTGLFAGKNLIIITAEAFNYTVIDPDLTPTLYRLATKGINFTNYYEPMWSGNTSGGELVNLSGLAMNCEMPTYTNQKPFNTMGWQLIRQGYYSRAYHNNGAYYYERDLTHENLGYEKFIAIGSGMENGVTDAWPQSDEEMFRYTIPDAIQNQPFSLYYMTVSAHCRYSKSGNAQSRNNWDLVDHLPYSNVVKAYLAANMEVEKALAFTVEQLEEAGIADDTVIVLAPDHFPYGLGTAWGNDRDYLGELYGMDRYDLFQRDKNTLIIWSGCLEELELQVDSPVCSVDILPTLSNLFGLEYDSRMSVGRDVLGTEEAIAIWPDYSWVTDLGKYNASIETFTPFTNQIPEGYTERISAIVRNRISVSRSIQGCNFFRAIQDALGMEY